MRTLIVLAVVALAGCAPVHIVTIPMEGGRYQTISTSSDADRALAYAVQKSREACKHDFRGSRLAVIDQHDDYNGLVSDKVNQAVTAAADVAAAVSGSYVPDLATGKDHRVTMNFRCEYAAPASPG